MSTNAGTLNYRGGHMPSHVRWAAASLALAVTLAGGVAVGRATAPGSVSVPATRIARILPVLGTTEPFPAGSERALLRATYHALSLSPGRQGTLQPGRRRYLQWRAQRLAGFRGSLPPAR